MANSQRYGLNGALFTKIVAIFLTLALPRLAAAADSTICDQMFKIAKTQAVSDPNYDGMDLRILLSQIQALAKTLQTIRELDARFDVTLGFELSIAEQDFENTIMPGLLELIRFDMDKGRRADGLARKCIQILERELSAFTSQTNSHIRIRRKIGQEVANMRAILDARLN